MNYLNILPDEIIFKIYSEYFKNNCLNEINTYKYCFICYNYLNKDNKDIFNCKKCNEPICNKCWKTVACNWNRGYQPYLYHCNSCKMYLFKTNNI